MDEDKAYIGIGSNIGDRVSLCQRAIEKIGRIPQTRITAAASFYETEPLELVSQDWFVNTVVEIRTRQSPEDLLGACQRIESSLGRERKTRYGPRTMDLDLLLMGSRIVDTGHLVLPHPRLHERRFVLVPLAEIAPKIVHPVLNRTIEELLLQVDTSQGLRRLSKVRPAPAR